MRSRFARPVSRGDLNVLSRLPHRHHRPAAGLGRRVSAGALPADVLLQLLVSLRSRNHRAFLEPRQLQRAPDQARLLGNVAAFHVDCRPRDVLLHAARLSARLLSLVPRRRKKRPLLSASNYSAVGQLSGARLRLEDDPRHRRRPEHAPAICAPHQSSSRFPALQPVRGRSYIDAHLYPLHILTHLRIARAHSAQPGRSLARSGSHARANFLARDLSALHSRSPSRSNLRLRPKPGRLPSAAAARRPERHHDLEHSSKPLRSRLQLALRCRHLALHAGLGARPDLLLGAFREEMEFPVSTLVILSGARTSRSEAL